MSETMILSFLLGIGVGILVGIPIEIIIWSLMMPLPKEDDE